MWHIDIKNQTYAIVMPSSCKYSPIPRLDFTIKHHRLVNTGSVGTSPCVGELVENIEVEKPPSSVVLNDSCFHGVKSTWE